MDGAPESIDGTGRRGGKLGVPRTLYNARMPREKASSVEQGVADALADFARLVRERFGEAVIDIRLFGSHARSAAHEESDVDVAVVLEEAGWDIRREIVDLAADIGLAHDLMLSPTVFDRETYERWRAQDRPLIRDIDTEGIRL